MKILVEPTSRLKDLSKGERGSSEEKKLQHFLSKAAAASPLPSSPPFMPLTLQPSTFPPLSPGPKVVEAGGEERKQSRKVPPRSNYQSSAIESANFVFSPSILGQTQCLEAFNSEKDFWKFCFKIYFLSIASHNLGFPFCFVVFSFKCPRARTKLSDCGKGARCEAYVNLAFVKCRHCSMRRVLKHCFHNEYTIHCIQFSPCGASHKAFVALWDVSKVLIPSSVKKNVAFL